ncbi:MAG: hypothetical protein HC808_07450 [Candidatus Competibacteraceae bacterium]|nr:hypothetical protein [Candidatus Competibacteraceae bacterium]
MAPARYNTPHSLRQISANDLSLTQVTRSRGAFAGARVRWGGTIRSLANEPGRTLVEVQAYALDQTGRPRLDTAAEGWFLARARIPYDEVVYAEGRPLTASGTLQGTVMTGGQVIPIIEVDSLYFWDQSPDAGDRYRYALRPNRSAELYYYPYRDHRPWRYRPWYWPHISLGLGYCKGCGGWRAYPSLVWPGSGFYFRYGY